jgi:Type II CAAX prenyl endopeptidase Rce1-like
VNVDSHHPRIGWQENLDSSALWAAKLRSRDFLEVALTYGLVLLALWTPKPLQAWLCWIILVWVVSAATAFRQDARTLGFRPSGLRQSLWVIGVAMLTAALAVWIAAQMHTLHPLRSGAGSRFWEYMLWAFLQQFLLQDFFLLRLLRLLPNKSTAVIAATVLFASAHIPNLLLVVVTLLWGATACALFLRYRDLYSLGIAHGILGICLAVTVPNAVHHEMRVGLGYFRYHEQRGPVHRSQSNHIVSTDAWVIADATRRCLSLQALP